MSGNEEKSTNADILQTVGTSTSLLSLLDNNSHTYNLGFTQTGPNVSTGVTSATFLPGVTSSAVTDTMTVSGPFGSDTTGVSNSFVEGPAAPERAVVRPGRQAGVQRTARRYAGLPACAE